MSKYHSAEIWKITRRYGKKSFLVAEIWENMLKIINAEIWENIAEI
jgi:hypothetical protein